MTFTSKLLGAVLAATLFTPSLTFAQAKTVTTKEAPPKSKAKAAAAPTAKEIEENHRARSAKMRVIVRVM